MKLKSLVRKIWHDFFYIFTFGFGTKIGLKCKDVSKAIDLGLIPAQPSLRFRHYLHLSFCEACNNYFKMSLALKKAAHAMMQNGSAYPNFDSLNQSLLKKYAQPK
jgi:hypothetical protein